MLSDKYLVIYMQKPKPDHTALTYKVWTEDEVNTLKNLCGKQPLKNIALQLNRPLKSIETKLHRLGISSSRIRKYKINHSFFDIIDTEEKAYWLRVLICRWNTGE